MANMTSNKMIDGDSEICIQSTLDLFSVPPTTVTVERDLWEELRPMNAVTNHGPYEFYNSGNEHYLDMAKNYMYMRIKIVQKNGMPIGHIAAHNKKTEPPPSFVAPINLIGATFFKQVKMIVNGKLTFDSGPDYAHLAYILTDLNNNRETKDGLLGASGWITDCDPSYKEEPEQLNTWRNPGLMKRYYRHINSRTVDYMTPLHIPFARQERYLLNNLDIRFELHRVSDAFALQTTNVANQYKIEVEDMRFFLRKVELGRDVCMAIETQLQRMPAKYPVRRAELKTLHIGSGRTTTPCNALWTGQLPRRVILCTLPNRNYYGSFDKNPFLFAPNNVVKVCLYVNSKCVPYSGPLEMTFYDTEAFGTSLVARAYVQFQTALGGTSNDIDFHRFTRDACYFVFDLSVDNTGDTNNWELMKNGTLSIYMEFSAPMTVDGLKVLALGEFDNLITIDKLRQIQYDYAV